MIHRLIELSLRNRGLVIAIYLGLAAWGYWALLKTPIDAIPDLSENQVIIFADWEGRSPIADSGYDMDTLARDAAALIEKLRAAPCHFVGLSMGGFIGMRLALRRPELLRSLTLIETAADPEPALNKPKYALMGLITRAFGTRPLLKPIMRIMFGRTFLRDPAKAGLRESLEQELLANDVRGSMLALRGVLERGGLMDELRSIRTPTLVLSGEEDVAVRPERSRRTAERIPGARFLLVPGAGHTSSLEQPETITAALRDFFASRA